MKDLAQRLKTLREDIGISQAKLAQMAHTTQASINRYENANSQPPLKLLLWYADFFDVSMDYIFSRTDQPEGQLYEYKPKVIEAMTQENSQLKEFVDMCFDPNSPVSEKLKSVLVELLQAEGKQ